MDNQKGNKKVLEQVSGPIKEYFEKVEDGAGEFTPGEDKIRLNAPGYGAPEVLEALESLLSTWVTMGEKVYEFENQFADYLGAASGLMVNSGSSANLVALKTLRNATSEPKLEPGDEIIAPAATWSTSIAPIMDIGCMPVLVDSDSDTFNLDPEKVKDEITSDTAAVMAVHLLGNPADLHALQDICDAHNLILIEDCAEAHGASMDGQKVGTFGTYGTYSFFFAHHISTIEGGMVVSSDADRIEDAKPVRAHGWPREMDNSEEIAAEYPDFDERYLFIEPGLNVRPTEVQGAFGLHQMNRLEDYIQRRRENAERLNELLSGYSDVFRFQDEQDGGRHVYYGYPLLVRDGAPFTREQFTGYLEDQGIETRPIMGGNLAEHPAFSELRERAGDLETAQDIHERGVFFGNHHRMNQKHTSHIADVIEEFLTEVVSS
ncbi:DegT/DnrJ/EryC1/StrS family aminotransferase [Salinibacter ruber]|uniref:DegT/DnrJ/EryC1/StrS family aminotransferase n=1 Tax=Salinibacter ruber TaxID=146919 RepID=UPI002167EEEA|nr:DegT/DnrJ/EryC1/StrS family aminotransferase [Salinibacter ruber]MCS4150709.1 CDP-6-deoxy-D-xylo-4-hexulose-3-dehydrase [Salinibacter ruber]